MRPVTYAVDEVSLDKARKNKQNCGKNVGKYDMNEPRSAQSFDSKTSVVRNLLRASMNRL
jgi:hypothetical protein